MEVQIMYLLVDCLFRSKGAGEGNASDLIRCRASMQPLHKIAGQPTKLSCTAAITQSQRLSREPTLQLLRASSDRDVYPGIVQNFLCGQI